MASTASVRRAVLVAIQPRFARAVFDRTKLFEYRRCRTSIKPDDLIFVYESAPTSAIVGEFIAGRVLIGDDVRPGTLESGIEMASLVLAYINGAKVASAIEIVDVSKWDSPVRLQAIGIDTAPMSYSFIAEEVVGRVRHLQGQERL